jgi:hypothetical protein
MAYKEPNVKEISQEGISEKEKEFLKDLRLKIERDENDRQQWKLKLIHASNQRMGIKRVSNYPYENAPDIPLPETDKIIKKGVPNLVLSTWSARKLCTVQPEDGSQITPQVTMQAKLSEEAMNLVLRNKMDLYNKLELAADYAKEKGHCIFKVVEDFNTHIVHKVIDLDDYPSEIVEQLKQATNEELKTFLAQRYDFDLDDDDDKGEIDKIIKQLRDGENVIEFDKEVINSYPNIEIPLPDKIIVPSYTTDLSQAERICEEYFLTKHGIEERMEQGVFIKKEMDELKFDGFGEDKDWVTDSKRKQEGVGSSNDSDDLYRIHDIYCWYKPEGEDCYQRWVFTVFADITEEEEALLRKIPFPFEFEGWNFERYDNEKKSPRLYNAR